MVNVNSMSQRGVLIANLGSPAGCDAASVRRYLNEFLMDPHVMDVPWPLRRLIVSAFVLPLRPRQSAEAYRAIWRDDAPGSPLIHHTIALAERLRGLTGLKVAVGMRYGAPGLAEGIASLGTVDEILLIPMYPQHAASTRTTTIERVKALTTVPVRVMPPFYARAPFLDAVARLVRETMAPDDHVVFSYHGLPERHLRKADPTGSHCLASADCCETPSAAHATCYRHQCLETTRALVGRLGIVDATGTPPSAPSCSTSFQSRLGRMPWLRPYTDELLSELPRQGVRSVTIACPAFTADNLETLEEIGIRGREIFMDAGGDAFRLAPCLNDDEQWARGVAEWCADANAGHEVERLPDAR
ncbi:MAG: ferrochelatase [Gammaproteobacteria bacterium]|nr:ferrochelatase [Gammaproteobacteria bacterium]